MSCDNVTYCASKQGAKNQGGKTNKKNAEPPTSNSNSFVNSAANHRRERDGSALNPLLPIFILSVIVCLFVL